MHAIVVPAEGFSVNSREGQHYENALNSIICGSPLQVATPLRDSPVQASNIRDKHRWRTALERERTSQV